MARRVGEIENSRIALITECSMSDNVAVLHPEREFVRPCNLCPFMKRITLAKIEESLREMKYEIVLPEDVLVRARAALDRMLAV